MNESVRNSLVCVLRSNSPDRLREFMTGINDTRDLLSTLAEIAAAQDLESRVKLSAVMLFASLTGFAQVLTFRPLDDQYGCERARLISDWVHRYGSLSEDLWGAASLVLGARAFSKGDVPQVDAARKTFLFPAAEQQLVGTLRIIRDVEEAQLFVRLYIEMMQHSPSSDYTALESTAARIGSPDPGLVRQRVEEAHRNWICYGSYVLGVLGSTYPSLADEVLRAVRLAAQGGRTP